jgi:hypothetical protein
VAGSGPARAHHDPGSGHRNATHLLRLLFRRGIIPDNDKESPMHTTLSRHWPVLSRIACLALVATVLSGCIIVPEHHWHPAGYYYYR